MAGIIDESTAAPGELGAGLQAGVDTISSNQTIKFTKYHRLVLPLDGYVFWVRATLLSSSSLYNFSAYNTVYFNKPRVATAEPKSTFLAKGSLHYATDTNQDESGTMAINRVVFTAEEEIDDLNEIDPNTIWVGEIDDLKFAFSSRSSFYRQAALWHYVGRAVYPDMATQLVDNPATLDVRNVIVSNSLPLWLALNNYNPFYGFGNLSLTLYPSFLLPENIVPSYASVHIVPDATRAIGTVPKIGVQYTHDQLCTDRVKITMYGMRNFNALDFVDCVLQRSADYDDFGLMNSPVVRDEKRTQNELNVIAQKKSVEFEISYYQRRVNDMARQLILSAVPTFNPGGFDVA